MAEENETNYSTSTMGEPGSRKNRTIVIILVVVLVLFCCCCIGMLGFSWTFGDMFVDFFSNL